MNETEWDGISTVSF
jgi:hypothetical protein